MESYNFATHVTHVICSLALTTYKYSELQVFNATQKLSYTPKLQNTPFSHNEGRFLPSILCLFLLEFHPQRL
jgi:hypothetical protein